MGKTKQQGMSTALAREPIRSLAEQFEDPDQMLAFLHACDTAQAALLDSLYKEHRFYCIQKALYLGAGRAARGNPAEVEAAWEEYRRASEEYSRARETLKKSIATLNMAADTPMPAKQGDAA